MFHVKGYTTRGPRGPWVAHLRKRSKATVEPLVVQEKMSFEVFLI